MENWKAYWKENKTGFDYIMRNTTKYFFEKYFSKSNLSTIHTILDYGCGPGILIEQLAPKNKKIVGVDISPYYISFCKEKFEEKDNVSFKLIDKNCPFKGILLKKKPDTIVALSVIQYFESEDILTCFLNDIREYSTDQNKSVTLVIADIIPTKHSMYRDALDVFFNSLRRFYLFDFFRFVTDVLSSDYRNSKLKVNQFDKDFFIKYAEKNKLKVSFLKKMTVHTTRYSVEMMFN